MRTCDICGVEANYQGDMYLTYCEPCRVGLSNLKKRYKIPSEDVDKAEWLIKKLRKKRGIKLPAKLRNKKIQKSKKIRLSLNILVSLTERN